MPNISKYFSWAIIITLLFVAVFSIFIENKLFSDIAKVTTIPLLLYMVINTVRFIFDGVIQICESEISIQESVKPFYNHYFENATTQLVYALNKLEDENCRDKEFWDDNKKLWDDEKNLMQLKIDYINDCCEMYQNIITRIKSRKWVGIIYTVSLIFLFLGMILSPLIATCFEFAILPIYALLALTFALAQALWSNALIIKVLEMEKQYFESTKN